MRHHSFLPNKAVAAALAALVGACQSHELNPVEPRSLSVTNTTVVVPGKQLAPNIMLVVDRSGSMTQSATGTGLACTLDGTIASEYDPRSTNPCKWNDLRAAFTDPATGFLSQSVGVGRFGLLAYPANTAACATGTIVVPISDDLTRVREQIRSQIFPGGGTPTSASLLEAAKDPALGAPEANRRRFVMLLTDGLPNCNAANQARCSACRSSSASCSAPDGCRPTEEPLNYCSPVPFDGAGCLDEDNLVAAVEQLRRQGIDTFVIGFGKETATSDAGRVLSRAAQAGGHPRSGAAVDYYQADTVEQLRTFLGEILSDFPCSFKLDPAPPDARLVAVVLRDKEKDADIPLVRGSEWEFATPTFETVRVLGDRCSLLQNAPPNRYDVVISFVGALE